MEHPLLEGMTFLYEENPNIKVNEDNRGLFMEIYPNKLMPDMFPYGIKQVSIAESYPRVLRGLHFQIGMDKCFTILRGMVLFVAVDLRRNSPTFGDYTKMYMNHHTPSLYIPSGFAIGYSTTSGCLVQYIHGARHNPDLAFTMAWDEPTLNINWEIYNPTLSSKDANEGISLETWQHTFESTLPEMQLTGRPLVG